MITVIWEPKKEWDLEKYEGIDFPELLVLDDIQMIIKNKIDECYTAYMKQEALEGYKVFISPEQFDDIKNAVKMFEEGDKNIYYMEYNE